MPHLPKSKRKTKKRNPYIYKPTRFFAPAQQSPTGPAQQAPTGPGVMKEVKRENIAKTSRGWVIHDKIIGKSRRQRGEIKSLLKSISTNLRNIEMESLKESISTKGKSEGKPTGSLLYGKRREKTIVEFAGLKKQGILTCVSNPSYYFEGDKPTITPANKESAGKWTTAEIADLERYSMEKDAHKKWQWSSQRRLVPHTALMVLKNGKNGKLWEQELISKQRRGTYDCVPKSAITMMTPISHLHSGWWPKLQLVCDDLNKKGKGTGFFEAIETLENSTQPRLNSVLCMVSSPSVDDHKCFQINSTRKEKETYSQQTAAATHVWVSSEKHPEERNRHVRGMNFRKFIKDLKEQNIFKKNTITTILGTRVDPDGSRSGHSVNLEWLTVERASGVMNIVQIIDTQNSASALAMASNSGNSKMLSSTRINVGPITGKGIADTFEEAVDRLWDNCCSSPTSMFGMPHSTSLFDRLENAGLYDETNDSFTPLPQNWIELTVVWTIACQIDGFQVMNGGKKTRKRKKKKKTRKKKKKKEKRKRKIEVLFL